MIFVYNPNRKWNSKIVGKRYHGIRESTLRREQLVRSEDLREELQGNLQRSQPTKTKDDAQDRNDFWSIEMDFIYRHHVEPRVQLYAPKGETWTWGKFGDLMTADHKVLSEGCELRNIHRYAVVVQDLATQWIQAYPCKTNTSQETQRSLQKFLEPSWKLEVIYTDNSVEFGKACEDLSWNHCTSTPHIGDQRYCRKSSAQSKRRHFCRVVPIRSGWKLVGRFHGMLFLSAKRSRSHVWWEDTYERRFGKPFEGPIIPCGSLVEYYPFTAKGQSRIQFGKKVLPGLFLGYALYAGEFERVTYWLQTLRSWRRWTHRKSARKDSMRRRWYFLKNKENLFFDRRWTNQTLGGDQDLTTSTLIRQRPTRGESHVDFLGESEGSLPPPHDSFPDAGEARNDFWCMSQETSYTAITLNPESSFTRREKNHSLFHWNTLMYPELLIRIWMSSKRNASMIIGISMGQEIYLILGQVSLNLL